MSRIAITGAKGQLGTDCVQQLHHHELLAVDLPEVDITSSESVRAMLHAFRPDILINCAAYTAVDKAESDAPLCARVNTQGPAILASACAEQDIYLVHISTDYVFDGTRPIPQPWLETDAPAPRTVYGQTKLDGEDAVTASGCRHAILRTAWLYGAHGRNFPKTMLRLALADPARTLRVVADQHGCPTCSFDLARQIQALIEAPVAPCGRFHAVSRGHTTWHDFASTFLRLMDVPHTLAPCTTADYPTPAQRPANSILEDHALDRLSLCVMPSWEDGLVRFVAAHRNALLAEARL